MTDGRVVESRDHAGAVALRSTEAKTIPTPASLTFLYHELRVSRSSYTYALTKEEFEQQVDLFMKIRRSGLHLWPEISFDDGHSSDYEYALPVLDSRGMMAHFFITVGWTGQKTGYMGWPEVRSLHCAGQRIGAHGWSHALLTHCSRTRLEKELAGARHKLEDTLGAPVTSMSLPGGRYNRRVLDACEEAGYTEVFTSMPREEAVPHGRLVGRCNVHSGLTLAAIEALLQPRGQALTRLKRNYQLKETAKSLLGDRLYGRLWALVNKQEFERAP